MIINPKAHLAIRHAAEANENALKIDGYDNAAIGTADVWYLDGSRPTLIVYSAQKILDIIMEDDISYEDALEHFYHNIHGAYMGPNTPIILNDIEAYR